MLFESQHVCLKAVIEIPGGVDLLLWGQEGWQDFHQLLPVS